MSRITVSAVNDRVDELEARIADLEAKVVEHEQRLDGVREYAKKTSSRFADIARSVKGVRFRSPVHVPAK